MDVSIELYKEHNKMHYAKRGDNSYLCTVRVQKCRTPKEYYENREEK